MNYNRTKSLGLSNKFWKTIHKIVLVVILHASFVAPSQIIFHKFYEIHFSKNTFSNNYISDFSENAKLEAKEKANDEKSSTSLFNNSNKIRTATSKVGRPITESTIFYADIVLGSIGYDNQMGFDNPKDNLFKINLSETVIDVTKKYFLEYEVNGVDENSVIGKSINDNYVTGGYLVKFKNEWIKKTEELDPSWLKKEGNIIFFNVPEGATYQYKIRNLVVKVVEKPIETNSKIVVNNQETFLTKEGKIYLNGFVKLNELSNKKIFANGQELELKGNLFEGYIKASQKEAIVFQVKENNILIEEVVVSKITTLGADESYSINVDKKSISKYFEKNTKDFLEINDAKLTIKDSALVENKFITSKVLRKIDLAPLESGMVNVTKGGKGYRFLPDGTVFNKPVALEIAYDSTLIPQGFSAKDIKTFYFDTKKKVWQALERDSIDYNQKRIVSQTTHFTDYINGIIQTPESPQTSAFTPTMMNDIKAADPSSEMTIIAPPSVSQKGDANVSYPIKIPAGRNGLQPQVAIQYNSDGGNGWLGQGWNIATPAITIDTKWGVPTFDTTNESEIYNLNGEQLMYPRISNDDGDFVDWMPNRHYDASSSATVNATTPRPRISNAVFTPRKQGSFSKIERKGDNISNYYWKVTNTDGTIYWYGGKDAVVNNAVIKNATGNIVHWALYMVEDVYKNNIKYVYTNNLLTNATGVNSNLNGGRIFRISNIYYTGYNNSTGTYSVNFTSTTGTNIRQDATISARLGVKEVEPYLLNEITVRQSTNIIRKYRFNYGTGKLLKSQLLTIAELDKNNLEFYKHTFEYHDDTKSLFSSPVSIQVPDFNADYTLGLGNTLNASRLNSSEATEFSWDVRLAPFGLQFFWLNNDKRRHFTFGLPFGESYTKNKGKITMADMDGNGLDDVLFKKDNRLLYYPHYVDSNNNHFFETNFKEIININDFSKTKGKTKTMFGESFDLYRGQFYLGKKRFKTKEETSIFITDGNGDMLPDIVSDNQVYFNTGLNNAALNNFETGTQNTPNLLITANPRTISSDDVADPEPDVDYNMGNYDVVRVWEAPFTGKIQIEDNLQFIPQSDGSKITYSIETTSKEVGNLPFRIYLKEFNQNVLFENLLITALSGNNPPLGTTNYNNYVFKGQKIYFRIHKENNNVNDVLISNPIITYIGYTSIDQNNFNYGKYDYKQDFVLSDEQAVEAPGTGNVQISWSQINVLNPSDIINYKIIQYKVNNQTGALSEQIIYSTICNVNSTTTVVPSANLNNMTITSNGSDESYFYKFFVTSDSNVRWNDFQWKPKLTYTPDSNALAQGLTVTVKYPVVKHSIYQDESDYIRYFALTNQSAGDSSNYTWVTPNYVTSYKLLPMTYFNPNSPNALNSNDNGQFLLVVKKNGAIIGKRIVYINSGVITLDNNNAIDLYTGNVPADYSTPPYILQKYECVFYADGKDNLALLRRYEKAMDNPLAIDDITKGTIVVGTSYEWDNFNRNTDLNHFVRFFGSAAHNANTHLGSMNRNWGQFLYNEDLDTNTTIPSDSYSKLINNYIVENPTNNNINSMLGALGINTDYCTSTYSDPEQLNNCLTNEINTSLGLPSSDVDENTDIEALVESVLANVDTSAFMQLPCFLSMQAFRYNDAQNIIKEKWIGLSDSQYSSPTEMRNEIASNSALNTGFTNPIDIESTSLVPNQQTGMSAISRVRKSVAVSYSAGRGNTKFSKSNSRYSNSVSDFIDLNGDRYPDIVTSENVQKTNMTGGHLRALGGYNINPLSSNLSNNKSLSYAGSYPIAGRKATESKQNDSGNPSYSRGLGLSANLAGKNKESEFFIDINGDGLIDRVIRNPSNGTFTYKLGTGNGFASSNSDVFNLLDGPETKPNSLNVSFSLNGDFYDQGAIPFSVSLGYNTSAGNTDVTLQDINGDGLVDLLKFSNNTAVVYYNLGNKFASQPIALTVGNDILGLSNNIKSSSASLSGEASYYRGFPICCPIPFGYIPLIYYKYGLGISGSANLTISETNKEFKDFNGDGFADYVVKDGRNITAYYSNIGRTDKLKTVTNPLGGIVSIDYKNMPVSYDNPTSKWVMNRVALSDGKQMENDGEDNYTKFFEYEKGNYDRRERSFYGYEKVIEKEYVNEQISNPEVYRTTTSEYHNKSYFLEGLLKKTTVVKGGAGSNNTFSTAENTYKIYKVNTNGTINLNAEVPATFDVGGTEGRRQAAVLLVKTKTTLNDFSSNAIITEVNLEYDEYSRVKKYTDLGDLANSQDDYFSEITYHSLNNNILNVPKELKVYQGTTLKRNRVTEVLNANTGDITKIKAWLSGTDFAETAMTYDAYGNLKNITYPKNDSGQAMFYDYTYDTLLNKYVTSIKDAFDYSSNATYDILFDKVKSTTDLAGNTMKYEYDSYGRTTKIIAPKEATNTNPYTIKFEYMPIYSHLSRFGYQNCISDTNFTPLAITKHFDPEHPTNAIETYTFIDGLARPIQVKKDIQINTGTTSSPTYVEYMSVSGVTSYDKFGRAIKQYHPKKEVKSSCGNFLVNQINSPLSNYFTETQYDAMDRPLKTIDPEGNESNFTYTLSNDGYGNLALMSKSIVDQNDGIQIISENFKDIRGRVTSNKNIGPGGDIWTKFTYNAINELLSYSDDEGLTTSYTYDNLGRKVTVIHPDNGTTIVAYDKANNMTKLVTANLASVDQSVNYRYNYNRLENIIYPANNGVTNISNVTYKFGATGSGNETGRLIYQQDATGSQSFKYGNMGEMIYNSRTIVAPNLPTRTFETQFEYDSWNRIQQLTYPDGEKVTYTYDLGGNLTQMTGQYNGDNYDYIEQIDYDHFEQRTYLKYGNQTETFYDYTPALRRLNNLVAKTSSGVNMFNNEYSYDKVGNITKLVNSATYNPDNRLGGTYSHGYTYDNLNRLTEATGDFYGYSSRGNDNQSAYSLNMKYNTTHGIVSKEQVHTTQGYLNNLENSYTNDYSYYSGTHKVKEIVDQNTGFTENFEYDFNGNLKNKSNSDGGNRSLFWDESNRLRVIDENEQLQHYIYDAAGERTLKASSRVEQVYENGQLVNSSAITFSTYTTYPSAFIVIDANQQYSKHYYAGSQRIVSKLGEEDVNIFEARRKTSETKGSDAPEATVSYETIKQTQIDDLQAILNQAKRGKVLFKEYKVEEEPIENKEGDTLNKAPLPIATSVGIYFFHPDHLGSSTFLTDGSGNPYQFFINLPFGETMYEQHSYSEDFVNPYKFNGKEQDIETGLYYYGARYYDPKTSIWLSVDPLAEDYPNIGVYVYCANNPINVIDPDGRSIIAVNEKTKNYLNKILSNIYKGDKFSDFRKLLTYNTKTLEYSKITKKDFNSATKNLTKKERALARGYFNAVNSKESHYMDIVSGANDKTSDFSQKYEKRLNNGQQIDALGGGGVTFAIGNGNTLTLQNYNSQADYSALDKNGEEVVMPAYTQRAATTSHELFGHAIDLINDTSAIKIENIYHQIHGTGLQRHGAEHNDGVPLREEKRSEIPKHLRDEN